MAFLKAGIKNIKAEDVSDGGESKYISKSGIYDVTLIAPFVSTGRGGSIAVDFYLEYKEQKQTVYGNLRVYNNDGKENVIGMKTFNKLRIIADVDEVADAIEADLPIGKKGTDKSAAVLEDLAGIECKIAITNEYGIYNGSITEKQVIRNFYTTEGFTAKELLSETKEAVQIVKDTEYYDTPVYKDELTEAQVKSWVQAKRPKNNLFSGAGSESGSADAPKTFKRKKFGA